MKRWSVIVAVLLIAVFALPACGEERALYVEKVENLPQDFIFGMDVSTLIALENAGVKYYDFEGREADALRVLWESGINHIRVRIWNDPYDEQGRGYGGGNCDLEKALALGRRAAEYGMGMIVNFHYSDFWADPGKQMVPKAWQGMSPGEKADAIYAYTKDALWQLKNAGADVRMVQVGNEINSFFCGERDWENICLMLQGGIRAVREVCPGARVALHFANPEKQGSYDYYARMLAEHQVDYDVFASSYYPYWHGTLENLSRTLSGIAHTHDKQVMVMETSYAYTGADSDFYGNTVGEGDPCDRRYPYTVQGQANHLRDLTDTLVNHTEQGIGLVYWEGAWIATGGKSWQENRTLWENFGTGWAASPAAGYDPKDAGQYYGGNAVDNQAFFDAAGHPLESLKVFHLMREPAAGGT